MLTKSRQKNQITILSMLFHCVILIFFKLSIFLLQILNVKLLVLLLFCYVVCFVYCARCSEL